MIQQSVTTSGKLTVIYIASFCASILTLWGFKEWNAWAFGMITLSVLFTLFISGVLIYLSTQNTNQVIGTTLLTFILVFIGTFSFTLLLKSALFLPGEEIPTQGFEVNLLFIMAFYSNIIIQSLFILAVFFLGIIAVYQKHKHEFDGLHLLTAEDHTSQHSIFHNFSLTLLHYIHYIALFIYLFTFFNIVEHMMIKYPLKSSEAYADFIQHVIALCIITPFYLLTLVYRRYILRHHEHYAQSVVRKLSRYSSLIALLFFGILLIALEYFILSKQLSQRKTMALMYVYAGYFIGIFSYYLYSAVIVTKEIKFHITIACIIAIVTTGVIVKSMDTFKYYPAEKLQADEVRTKDLRYIIQDIELYKREKGKLPSNLSDLKPYNQSNVYSTGDPVTKKEYKYTILNLDRYELCASFDTPLNFDSSSKITHSVGNNCFTRDLSYIQESVEPAPLIVPTPSGSVTPIPTPTLPVKKTSNGIQIDAQPWGVAKQIDEVTWTMKIQDDNRMATPQETFEALNQYRRRHNSNPLSWDANLAKYAAERTATFEKLRSADKHEGFTNYLKDQDNFKRLGFWSLGENSSYGYKMEGVHLIEWIFAGDEPHNKNQLNPDWSHVGISIEGLSVDIIFGKNKI